MNISELARSHQVSTDTVRYYEKQGLLSAPLRQENGYRAYTPEHARTLQFVRGAQALGFTLTEIRQILPQVARGTFGRGDIERQLQAKMAQIDAHMVQLRTLKKELQATFASLTCEPGAAITTDNGTAPDSGSGAGRSLVRKAFSKTRKTGPVG